MSFFGFLHENYVYYIKLLWNPLTGILWDTDMTQVPSEMALSSSQRHAFQYVSRILSNMEPFSNEEIEVDIDETDGNNRRFSFFQY